MRTRVLLFALPLLASVAFGQDTLDLTFRPKPNEIRKFDTLVNFDMGGTKIDVHVKQTNKVLEVTATGDYKQEVTTDEQKLLVNSEEQESPNPPKTTHRRSARGDVLELSSKITTSLSQCISFIRTPMLPEKPLAVGDKWTREFKKNDDLGTSGCKLQYELLSRDKVGTVDIAKIKVNYSSDEKGTATGELWVRISDGTSIQLDASFEGLTPAAGTPDASGTIKIKLTEG